MPGALLVADKYVSHAGRPERVVRRQDSAAWQAEDDIDALALQASDESLGSSHFHGMLLHCAFARHGGLLGKQKTSWPNRPRRSSASPSVGSRYVIRITRNWLIMITVIFACLLVR
jgi:hypothetical protein